MPQNALLGEPLYHGSVQNLYQSPDNENHIISETTSGGSVFDVGTIYHIDGSDAARTCFRHYIFTKLANPKTWQDMRALIAGKPYFKGERAEALINALCENGANTHHVGMLDTDSGQVYKKEFSAKPSNLTLIEKFQIHKPKAQKGAGVDFYDYASYAGLTSFVIPLEFIVRFGVTSGSSILSIYNALNGKAKQQYLSELGQTQPLTAWSTFQTPINDFTTKYEPSDRSISNQEAALISSVSGELFMESILLTKMASFVVQQIFKDMGLVLWDLKWEVAVRDQSLVFVDTIDTDSVRATLKLTRQDQPLFVHFNKQAMRDYYKIMHPKWFAAINDAKKIATAKHTAFTIILKAGQANQSYPQTPIADVEFLAIQKNKFDYIARYVTQNAPHGDHQGEVLAIANQELDYYENLGKLADYTALNGA